MVDEWLRSILWESQLPLLPSNPARHPNLNFEIHRLKAVLRLTNGAVKIVQGVREIFEITDSERQEPASFEASKFVLIGRALGKDASIWQESLLELLGNAKTVVF